MNYVSLINRFKVPVIIISLLFIAVGFWFAKDLNFNPSLETRFLKDNQYLNSFKDFNKEFGQEPLLIVVWESGRDIWRVETFNRLKLLTARIEELPGVASVYSMASIIDGDGLNYTDFSTLKQLSLVRKLLVSKDGKKEMLLIIPDANAIVPSEGLNLTREIKKVLSDFVVDGENAYLSGPLAMQSEAIDLSRDDLIRAILFVSIFALIIFTLIYRSFQAVIGALFVTLFSIAGASGILAISNIHLSQFALIAFPILAAISLQDVVHLIEHYDIARREKMDPVSACRYMLNKCAAPCLWTSITTCVGFGAILVSNIEQVNSIGKIVLIGAPLAFIASVISLPALLMLFKGWPKIGRRVFDAGIDRVVKNIFRHAKVIAFSFLILIVVGFVGIYFVKMQFDFPNIFSPRIEFQKNLAKIDEDFGGAASFELMLETNDGSDFSDIAKIELVKNLQTALSLTASVTETISPIDIGITGYVLKNGMPADPKAFRKSSGKIIKKILKENKAELANWLSPDLKRARIHARMRMDKNQYYGQLLGALSYLKKTFSKSGIDISWSGFSLLYKDMEARMLTELVRSFMLAFVGVAFFMIILFRSVKWGVLAMIPNILPIVIVVGIMGLTGVGFSLGLIILPAVGLGLIVDDTIHIIWNIRKVLKEDGYRRFSFTKVFSTTGRALILTTLILSAGFLSLIFSPFVSNVQLAILMPLLLILALIFDFISVPTLMYYYYKYVKRVQQSARE